ncbi:efflux transporter outer membrane subunit [Pseudomonas aeruginosa]
MATTLKPVDAVVVGFGWTGAILAKELTEAGLNVVALERGENRDTYPDGAYPNTLDELTYNTRGKLFQNLSKSTVSIRHGINDTALPYRQLSAFLPGDGVGGAGLHWSGVHFRIMPEELRLRSHYEERYGKKFIPEGMTIQDYGVSYEELEPHFDFAEKVFGTSGTAHTVKGQVVGKGNPFAADRSDDFPLPALRQVYSAQLFRKAAEELGLHPYDLPAANASGPWTNPYGVQMGPCNFCGFCSGYACYMYSKASPNLNILPALRQTPLFELRANCNVLKVNLDSDGRQATGVTYVDAQGREIVQPAKLVIISAFQFHNVRLLLLSGIGKPYDPRTGEGVANDRFPVVTSRASADIGKGQQPGVTEDRVNSERYDLGLDSAWELDLFGRIRRQLESSDALSEAAEADLQQLQVSLIAELVDAYGQLRGAQLREKIALSNLENQKESRQLTEQLRDAGVGAELDVLRADARLAATAASVPQLQAEAERARHRIATLLGQRPEELTVDLSPRDLPAITKALPIGDSGELLRRRPDIRAAERRLAASTADVGVATADLFPRVSLSGFLGFTAGRGSQIGSSAARAWSVGPSISWAAFDLGSVRARLHGAKADADAALASYEQQVLLALEESANAFSDYGKRQERLVSLVRQSEASRAAAQQAAIRYREGTTDFLVLLDAEREQLSAEDAQAQAEVELYRGIVAIYRSLGGGWQPSA